MPKIYHPFICGPKNENVERLIKETGAKINVPPPSVMKDEIVISGDKDGVAKCKDEIMRVYMDKVKITFNHIHNYSAIKLPLYWCVSNFQQYH